MARSPVQKKKLATALHLARKKKLQRQAHQSGVTASPFDKPPVQFESR